ncbi:MAG: AAA family ATPase [Pyrinomonadaceae bacterium]|nr:AAA family ATPase [Pyrinomonadaceae bacterium]
MLLESLEVENFRNLRGKMFFGKGLNIIFGENGQGKTNWLEAIYTLATTKSFKTAKLHDAINFDQELGWIRGSVQQSAEIRRTIQVTLQNNSKTLSINGKKETVNRYLGQLYTILFNADELEIIRGTPENRRKFLDAGIVGIYPPSLSMAMQPKYPRDVLFWPALAQSQSSIC